MRWLGFDWGKHLYHASDYFERLYGWAEDLIRAGKAYVDDQIPHDMRTNRGTLTEPGKNSPFRDRSVEENLDLFRRMRAGEFPNGARVLRAKIDMASGNINLRDPVMYRILHANHPRTGNGMEDLSELRLRSWPVGCDRAGSPIRSARWNSRIIGRSTTGSSRIWMCRRSPHQIRVRAAQSDLHGAIQARADRVGARRTRQRMGRPAHADLGGLAPARRSARGHSRFRQAHRRRKGQ